MPLGFVTSWSQFGSQNWIHLWWPCFDGSVSAAAVKYSICRCGQRCDAGVAPVIVLLPRCNEGVVSSVPINFPGANLPAGVSAEALERVLIHCQCRNHMGMALETTVQFVLLSHAKQPLSDSQSSAYRTDYGLSVKAVYIIWHSVIQRHLELMF